MSWSDDIATQILEEFVDSAERGHGRREIAFADLYLPEWTKRVRENAAKSMRGVRERRRMAGLCIWCGCLSSESVARIDRERATGQLELLLVIARAPTCNDCKVKRREAKRMARMQEAEREKLAKTREGVTLHFTITARAPDHMQVEGQPPRLIEVDGYVRTGTYEDGRLGEFFITVARGAEEFGPAIDRWAEASSIAIQYGAPVDAVLKKSLATRGWPDGPVQGVKGISKCTSPHDLIARWLLSKYGSEKMKERIAVMNAHTEVQP
jgi:hypothetical protein